MRKKDTERKRKKEKEKGIVCGFTLFMAHLAQSGKELWEMGLPTFAASRVVRLDDHYVVTPSRLSRKHLMLRPIQDRLQTTRQPGSRLDSCTFWGESVESCR